MDGVFVFVSSAADECQTGFLYQKKKKFVCFNKKKIIAKNVRSQSGMDKSDDCFRRQEITDFFRSRNASRHEIFAGSSETTSKILLRSRENVVKIRQVNTLLCYQIPKDMKWKRDPERNEIMWVAKKMKKLHGRLVNLHGLILLIHFSKKIETIIQV